MDKMFLEGCFLQHVYVGVMVISLFTYIYPGLFLARRGGGGGGGIKMKGRLTHLLTTQPKYYVKNELK